MQHATGHGPQLITYADRLGGDVRGLTELLRGSLAGVFDGVHILPYYTPHDGPMPASIRVTTLRWIRAWARGTTCVSSARRTQ